MTMLSFLLIIIPLLSQSQAFSSPLLFRSTADLPQSAVSLSTLSPVDIISNYICKLNSKQIEIRLFAVNELTHEDIQRGSQNKHPVLLDAKNENSQYRYFPNVADAYQTFSSIPQSNHVQCSHIDFQITSSAIYDTPHDALNAMKTSIDNIDKKSNTVVVMALTSGPVAYQSLTRERRDIEVDEEDILTSESQSCMFYAKELFLGTAHPSGADGNYTLDYEKSSCMPYGNGTENQNTTSVLLNLVWTNATDTIDMKLIANITDLYWYLESVMIENATYRYFAYGMRSNMDTPVKFSYACTTAMFVKINLGKHGGVYDFQDKFYIRHFQFQPFFANGSYFGPPNYCTSFFTSGIWMGLTSSLLCLGILLFGIYRLMSIKSNDRFDDPKGKPLIIKAQE